MNVRRTGRFFRNYHKAPLLVQQAFEKQVRHLKQNLRHPSLHAKKFDEANDIWQARVTGNWRFYFQIEKDVYVLLDILAHPK